MSLNEENNLIEERKNKLKDFLKNKKSYIFYIILVGIIALSVYIRTINIGKLKDITTGTWTLGPDLDPFLFLRWAEYIVEHGKLMMIDTMRNVPLGFNTSGEMKLLAYLIAWFHKLLLTFGLTDSITFSAILFPVVAFSLTAFAFFLFSRKVFNEEDRTSRNIIALVATLLFVLIPSLLPRTIAGIPEKESIAFFFIFLTFYFFICSFINKNPIKSYLFAIASGISTGLMALVWGGSGLAFMTIAAAVLFSFLLGKIDKTRFYSYLIWIATSFILMMPFSTRYTLKNLIVSTSTGSTTAVLFIIFLHIFIVEKTKIKNYFEKIKFPKEFISFVASIILLIIISSLFFGINFVPTVGKEVISQSVHPLDVSRFGLTVAENKQPFFINDWKDSFGPAVKNIPLFFWLFFIGSIALFYSMIRTLDKKERYFMTFSYFVFLFTLIFSKYSANSILNGNSTISLIMYFGGMIFFIISFFYIYIKKYRKNEFESFKNFNFGYILYFIILTLAVIAARGGIRLIMILAAVSPLAIAFINVKLIKIYSGDKGDLKKFILGILIIITIISTVFSAYSYYKIDRSSAENYAPGIYQYQWQEAMAFVRENTPENAVFAHWWDYGYWLQSIGKRATVLDGGNAITYWNFFMGRYVLTESDERKSIEFLYAHNATHLLIDSTEIGKYTAFSSIGSDQNYDRFSWIQNFILDDKQSYETRNQTLYFYAGGSPVDEDIVWNENGKQILLPRNSAALGAILLSVQENDYLQPEGIFVYQNNQYRIPLRYLYNNNELKDFKTGLEAGVFIYPAFIEVQNGQGSIRENGALLYLSNRTINSMIARLYLFNQNSDYFRLIHVEDDYIVKSLNQQGLKGNFIYYGGLRGPIKIWEIKYPSNIKLNETYLETNYPSQEIKIARPGFY